MLHEGIHALLLSAGDLVGSHNTREQGVLGEVLEGTAGESATVDVHSRSVPTSNVHVMSHVADHLAELLGQILVPSAGECGGSREADGANAGEVVVQRGRTVSIGELDLANGGDSRGAVATVGDEVVHIIEGQLVKQLLPISIVVILAVHVSQAETILGTGGRHFVGIIVILGRIIVAVVGESSLDFVAHGEVGRGCGGFSVVREVIGAGQIGHIASGIVELVGSHGLIIVVGVRLGVVGDGVSNVDPLGIDHMVRIGLDRDGVITLLQHPSLGILVVIGSHIVIIELDLHSLRGARLKLPGLLESDEVLGGLLDTAIGVRRVVVDLNNVLAGGVASVGDGHIKRDLAILVENVTHLLLKAGVRQAVTERIDDRVIVVDQTFIGCSLIELVAHINPFDIVNEGRKHGSFLTGEAGVLSSQIVDVIVDECTIGTNGRRAGSSSAISVVEHWGLGQILNERVGSLAGRVGFAREHVTEYGEAGLACRRAPQHGLDLRVVAQEVELESICTVIDERDLVEVLGDQVNHVALSLAQLQEVLTILEVIIILGVVLVGNGFGLHVGRQISTFATDTGDHHNSLIGEALGVRNQRIGILAGRNLRQGPILGPHSNNRTVRTIVGVQLAQIGVGFKTSFLHAIKQGNGVVLVRHGAGAGASIDRVGGAPNRTR